MTVRPATLVFERDYPVSPDKVFAAFADPKAVLDWGSPGEGWEMRYDAADFSVGGTDLCRFGPVGEGSYVNAIRYEVIEPGRRIVQISTLSHKDMRTFVGVVAIEFTPTATGTRLKLTEIGVYVDGADNPEGHEEGWSAMLDQLGGHLGKQRKAA